MHDWRVTIIFSPRELVQTEHVVVFLRSFAIGNRQGIGHGACRVDGEDARWMVGYCTGDFTGPVRYEVEKKDEQVKDGGSTSGGNWTSLVSCPHHAVEWFLTYEESYEMSPSVLSIAVLEVRVLSPVCPLYQAFSGTFDQFLLIGLSPSFRVVHASVRGFSRNYLLMVQLKLLSRLRIEIEIPYVSRSKIPNVLLVGQFWTYSSCSLTSGVIAIGMK